MGLFDEVNIKCPSCRHNVVIQSKAGPCLLNTYKHYNLPASIAEELHNTYEYCDNCDAKFKFHAQVMVNLQVEEVF